MPSILNASQRSSPNSFPCHTSEKSPANSNHCHTSENPLLQVLCLPHIQEPPGGGIACLGGTLKLMCQARHSPHSSLRLAANFPQNTVLFHINLAPSNACALFSATEHSKPISFQSFPHSFPCDGGGVPSHLQIPKGFLFPMPLLHPGAGRAPGQSLDHLAKFRIRHQAALFDGALLHRCQNCRPLFRRDRQAELLGL
jgi:hypothetical protein